MGSCSIKHEEFQGAIVNTVGKALDLHTVDTEHKARSIS